MKMGEPVDRRVPWVRELTNLNEAREIRSPGPQLRALRKGARALGDELRASPRVVAVKTLHLTTLLYPTTFAFNRAVPLPWPYVQMFHRCLLVQVMADGELKNILFNPTDYEASRATPYFAKMLDKVGERGAKFITTQYGQVDAQLRKLGLSPEDIDIIAFDHFHTQDVRPLLGDGTRAPRFPNAYLLASRKEWEDWGDLHPLQRSWFVADGKQGVPEDRVILTDTDVALGDGCLILQTPGHTTGNQTLFVHGEQGVFGCSENGTSADSWAPTESRIPGLKKQAELYDFEVVLNTNTPELWADQYTSMIVEKELVDKVPDRPEFVQMFPSSEVTPSAFAPGVRPSMIFTDRDSGKLQTTRESTLQTPGDLSTSRARV
ncbi:MAG: hypothetical protein KJN97_10435 [Deltaproteobacteria bacterium]|nr:hypothetical protein [Deltaproteobacteria bacterium]